MSSFIDRQCQSIAVDRINASIFFYPNQPENPLLSRLFSDQDIQMLLNWFYEYKIGDDLTWIDLIGLRCYDLLKRIEKLSRQKDLFIQEWSPLYLVGYVSLFYETQTPVKDGSFFITAKTFAKKLNSLSADFKDQFKFLFQKWNQKGRERLKNQADALIQEWDKTSILFGKFLLLPNPSAFLCEQTISGCSNSLRMIPSSEDERKQAISHLIMYMKLHEEALHWSKKKGWIGLEISYHGLIQKIHDLRNQWGYSSQKKLLARGDDFFEHLATWKRLIHKMNQSAQEEHKAASSGELTHQQWCERHQLPLSKTTMPQSEFIERTTQSLMLGTLLIGLSSDYRGIVENCILQSSDHSLVARANRFRSMANSILEFSFEEEPALFEIRDQFKEKWKAICSNPHIQKVLNNHQINHNDLVFFEIPKIRDIFFSFHEEMSDLLDQLVSKKGKDLLLSQIELNFWTKVFILLHDLKVLTHYGSSSLQESEIFPNPFLELFESLEEEQYFPGEEEESPLGILEELPPIVQLNLSGTSLSHSKKIEEELDGEEMLSSSSLTDSIAISESGPSFIHQAAQKTKEAQAISKRSRKDRRKDKEKTQEILLERKRVKVEQMLQEMESSPAIPEKLEEILEEKKKLKVERILRALGLEPLPTKYRGKGDHKIWKDPQNRWGQTIIPDHDELKEGTRHAIVSQLLNKKRS